MRVVVLLAGIVFLLTSRAGAQSSDEFSQAGRIFLNAGGAVSAAGREWIQGSSLTARGGLGILPQLAIGAQYTIYESTGGAPKDPGALQREISFDNVSGFLTAFLSRRTSVSASVGTGWYYHDLTDTSREPGTGRFWSVSGEAMAFGGRVAYTLPLAGFLGGSAFLDYTHYVLDVQLDVGRTGAQPPETEQRYDVVAAGVTLDVFPKIW